MMSGADPESKPDLPRAPFLLADILVHPDRGELVRDGQTVRLDHKHMELLLYLAANPGRDIPHEELISAVWGTPVYSEDVLYTAISGLRKALGESGTSLKFIKTIPRTGYRLLAQPAAPVDAPPIAQRWNSELSPRFLIKSLLFLLFLLVLFFKSHAH